MGHNRVTRPGTIPDPHRSDAAKAVMIRALGAALSLLDGFLTCATLEEFQAMQGKVKAEFGKAGFKSLAEMFKEKTQGEVK